MSIKLEGKRVTHLIAEGALAVFFVAIFAVVHFAKPPFNRGFFCDDKSIQKPYVSKQAVPSIALLVVGLLLCLVVVSEVLKM